MLWPQFIAAFLPAACDSYVIISIKTGTKNSSPLILQSDLRSPNMLLSSERKSNTLWLYLWVCGHLGEEVDLSEETGFNLCGIQQQHYTVGQKRGTVMKLF